MQLALWSIPTVVIVLAVASGRALAGRTRVAIAPDTRALRVRFGRSRSDQANGRAIVVLGAAVLQRSGFAIGLGPVADQAAHRAISALIGTFALPFDLVRLVVLRCDRIVRRDGVDLLSAIRPEGHA